MRHPDRFGANVVDKVMVLGSQQGPARFWFTTTGLEMQGLYNLELRDVPPLAFNPADILNAAATLLIDLIAEPAWQPVFPTTVGLTGALIDRAYGRSPSRDWTLRPLVLARLTFLSAPPNRERLLAIRPPRDFPGCWEEWLVMAWARLNDVPEDGVRCDCLSCRRRRARAMVIATGRPPG